MKIGRSILASFGFLLLFGGHSAQAEESADPTSAGQPVQTTAEGVKVGEDGMPIPPAEEPEGAQFGVGLRLRNVRLPQSELELFVDRASGGSSELGIGADLIRRTGDFELHLGLQYDPISVPKGVWVEKGKPIPGSADLVEFNGFGWVTLEANFINHRPFNKKVALRYGAGVGLAVLVGDVTHVDKFCSTADTASCTVDENGGVKIKYDLKSPVYPLLSGLIGVQFRATDKVTINLEAGIRTVLPFFGVSSAYFF